LELGLEPGTAFSLGSFAEAETLPPRGVSSKFFNADHSNQQTGMNRYRDLVAIHDWSAGTVYRAFHEGLQRFVLLRVLESSVDDNSRREFISRAEKLSQLNHPHIAATLEAGVDHGTTYIAEEWVDGSPVDGFQPRSKRQRWAEGFFPNIELMEVMRAVASGLAAIHQAGLTHDRLSPDSIVRDKGGNIKLVDLGEASESSDTRFAMPIREASIGDKETRVSNATANQPSVEADLFRLGATFCFLTTSKLPTELDPNLDRHVLARRLKQCNRGLRNDLCHLIAGCIAGDPIAANAKPRRPVTGNGSGQSGENPYKSTAQAGRNRYATAEEVVDELSRLLQSGSVRIDWRRRFYSGYLEPICVLVLASPLYSILGIGGAAKEPDSIGFWKPVLFVCSPIFYAFVLETCLGWTIVRRAFGMRLLDHAGERGVWWQRMWRAFQKTVLLVLLLALPATIIPLLTSLLAPADLPLSGQFSGMISMLILIPILQLIMPTLGLYLPSRWIPSRWTFYDLQAGMTWGEETQVTAKRPAESTLAVTPSSRLTSPTCIVDQYELYESLGSGGMGQVFRGRDRILGRDVAIKLLSGSLVDNPLLLERFQREARLAAKVDHPGVARVFGNGVWNQTPYIVMELVPGSNLQQQIKEMGTLPLSTAWDYTIQAAEALRAADRSGVVHRDIKPANLMVTGDGRLKVTDFGVSRSVSLDCSGESQGLAEMFATGVDATGVGVIVGTPAYMAPEQAMGKEVDRRSDIYALGMTLYHMLSGRAPFKADDAVSMLAQQMWEQPASLLGKVSALTFEQAGVLERMIAKQPADRYYSYDELLIDLRFHAPGTDRLASPLKRITAEALNLVALYLLFTVGMSMASLGFIFLDRSMARWMIVGFFLLVLLAIFSMNILWVKRHGKTLGKRVLALRVVDASGAKIGYLRAAVRFMVTYPLLAFYFPNFLVEIVADRRSPTPAYVWYGLLMIQLTMVIVSVVMMWRRSDRRTLHDLAAGTIVVNDKQRDFPTKTLSG
jgi:serine/threonine protein kinase